MNKFFILWYLILASCGFGLFDMLSTYEIRLSNLIPHIHYINYYWILIIYLFSEICFVSLCRYHQWQENKLEFSEIEKKQSLKNISIIIPIHKTPIPEVESNIIRLKKIFTDGYIHIAENNGNKEMDNDLVELCQSHNVFYHHYSFANKSSAIFNTAKYIKSNLHLVKHVILLDDDTVISDDFFLRDDILQNPSVAGYTCTIGIGRKSKNRNWIEECIDLEYRTISFRNRSRNLSTLRFLHGIICIYKIDPLLEIYKLNPCNLGGLPFGEDAFAGVRCRFLGYKMKQDHLNVVLTFCPTRLYPSFCNNATREQGYGASTVFKQRAKRWYISWLRRLPDEIALLLCFDIGSWVGNILYRLDFLWYIYITIISSIWMILVFAILFDIKHTIAFLIIHVGFYFVNIIDNYFRIWNMSEKEKEGICWYTPLIFYWFNINILFMYTFAFLYSIFYYIPFVRIDYKKLYNFSILELETQQNNRI